MLLAQQHGQLSEGNIAQRYADPLGKAVVLAASFLFSILLVEPLDAPVRTACGWLLAWCCCRSSWCWFGASAAVWLHAANLPFDRATLQAALYGPRRDRRGSGNHTRNRRSLKNAVTMCVSEVGLTCQRCCHAARQPPASGSTAPDSCVRSRSMSFSSVDRQVSTNARSSGLEVVCPEGRPPLES
jgi:hypothetical protein